MSQASRSPATAPAASPETRIKKLEQQLSIITAERNDLAADVESLCMQSSGDIFSASSVLSERICNLTKEANRLHSQVLSCACPIMHRLTTELSRFVPEQDKQDKEVDTLHALGCAQLHAAARN